MGREEMYDGITVNSLYINDILNPNPSSSPKPNPIIFVVESPTNHEGGQVGNINHVAEVQDFREEIYKINN